MARKAAENGAEATGQHLNEDFQIPEGWATILFENGIHLQEQYERLVEARRANRDMLRNLSKGGLLSEEERALLVELYPERPRKAKATTEEATEEATEEEATEEEDATTPEPAAA